MKKMAYMGMFLVQTCDGIPCILWSKSPHLESSELLYQMDIQEVFQSDLYLLLAVLEKHQFSALPWFWSGQHLLLGQS